MRHLGKDGQHIFARQQPYYRLTLQVVDEAVQIEQCPDDVPPLLYDAERLIAGTETILDWAECRGSWKPHSVPRTSALPSALAAG